MATTPADRIVQEILDKSERIELRAEAVDAIVAVTDRRVAIADDQRLMLETRFEGLRRIQFDIERERPATLVIVPESPQLTPQVLAIPPEQFEEVGRALAHIGRRLLGT
jgi:hypothetical protein